MKTNLNRRQFLQGTAALAGAALTATSTWLPAAEATKRTATDQVTLGKTGIKLSRLGMGTGSNGGRTQRDLGQEGFTRLVRHAYDQGITYIDTAGNYNIHEMIGKAIKGLPREKLYIQSKLAGNPGNARERIDEFRQELGTDYLDSLLIHCATKNSWHEDLKRLMDVLLDCQDKKIIRAKGVSCHGLPGLTRAAQVDWVDVHLVRINHVGRHMDGTTGAWSEASDREKALQEIRTMRQKGRGIIGMKLIGNGEFTSAEEREKSIRYVMQSGLVDAAVIGFKSTAEIDEGIERVNRALAG
jgi:predicted aldo/keto reductase-like oxidoreductase